MRAGSLKHATGIGELIAQSTVDPYVVNPDRCAPSQVATFYGSLLHNAACQPQRRFGLVRPLGATTRNAIC
jgi:hypothetical protein